MKFLSFATLAIVAALSFAAASGASADVQRPANVSDADWAAHLAYRATLHPAVTSIVVTPCGQLPPTAYDPDYRIRAYLAATSCDGGGNYTAPTDVN